MATGFIRLSVRGDLHLRKPTGAISLLILSGIVGCGRSDITPPSVNPAAASSRLIAEKDANGDGMLSQDELGSSPGLLAAFSSIDSDKDGLASTEELTAALERLYSAGAAMTSVRAFVTRDGKPLANVRVRYVPEDFLQDAVQAAEGVTDQNGVAKPSVPADKLPADLSGVAVMQQGYYRVELNAPDGSIPSDYSGASSPLGHAVDTTIRGGMNAEFKVSKR